MLHHISTRQKIIVMSAVMSGLFLVALDQTIIATALGAITTEFDSFSSLGFIVTAYMLTSTVTVPLAGKLSDMYGRRPILIGGVLLFTAASLVSGLAPNMGALIAARALQGVGGGMIMANAFTIVGDLFNVRERGKWQGFIGAVFGIASVIGPMLGGWLTDGQALLGLTTDWRWTFFINVPIGIIAALIIARYTPHIKHDSVHKPDYIGALFITLALASLILAVDNTAVIFASLIDQGISLMLIQSVLVTIFMLASAGFIVTERRAAQPILSLKFFENKTFRLISLITLLFGAAFLGSILYLTQFNQQVFDATASEAGYMLLPMMAGMMSASIGVGQLISRVGRYKRFIIAGFTLTTLGIASLTLLTPTSPYWHEAVVMVFVGLGLGTAMPIFTLAIQNEFEQKDLGAATASVQLFRGLGSTIGTAALSGVLTIGILQSIGEPSKLEYIQTLQDSPSSKQLFKDDISADTLLQINSQQAKIYQASKKALDNVDLAPAIRRQQLDNFKHQQVEYKQQITKAFTSSLHMIFSVSAVLMLAALALATRLPDVELAKSPDDTPGV